MPIELGLQLFSVRNALQSDYAGTLEKIAAIGYKNLELITTVTENGLTFGEGLTPAQLKGLLAQTGLRAVGCHVVPTPDFPWAKVIDSLLELDVHHLGCAIAFFEKHQDVLDFCTTFNKDAELCRKNGIQYHYHNHHHEFQKLDGHVIYDTLLANTDKDLVKIEFDTYWAVRGGQDPVEWIKKLGDRCDLLHQKDLPATTRPVDLISIMGDKKIGRNEFVQGIAGNDQFTEVGQGVLDVPGIIAASRAYGKAEYMFVEQDRSNRAELESIAISYAYLNPLLQ